MKKQCQKRKGQSAIEYLILATTITAVVLMGFDEDSGFLLQARNLSEAMFNQALRGVMGTNSQAAARTNVNAFSTGEGYP